MSPRAVLLKALAGTPTDIQRLTGNMGDEAWQWRSEAGAESCLDIVHHLLDAERKYRSLLERVLLENQPDLRRWSDSHPDGRPSLPPQETLRALRSAREATLDFLGRLSPGDWQRPAQYGENGRITLRFLVQEMVDNDIYQTHKLAGILYKWRAYQET